MCYCDSMVSITSRRKELGLEGRALAAKAGVDPGTISRVERGLVNPSLAVAQKIAEALGLRIEDIDWTSGGDAA